MSSPRVALVSLGLYCPESSQTSAQGTCYIQVAGVDHCVSRCRVDPDGEGNMRGLCTFE
jgi:hypothetical protein